LGDSLPPTVLWLHKENKFREHLVFCLHEHKPEEGMSNDPYGQLLIVMIAAQQVNLKIGLDIPVYGLYNLGRYF